MTQLNAYMHGLPMYIFNIDDAKKLSRKQSGQATTLFSKGDINKAIALILPNEKIYFMEWAMYFNVTNTKTGEYIAGGSGNVIFFSDTRFFGMCTTTGNVFELPLADIYTVATNKGIIFSDISFRTQELTIVLKNSVANNIELIREMIIHIAASATAKTQPVEMGIPSEQTLINRCVGCGATLIIHSGTINKCEYCSRLAEQEISPMPVAPQTASPATSPLDDVAEQLKKYKELLDMGAISVVEFELIKSKLLNKL